MMNYFRFLTIQHGDHVGILFLAMLLSAVCLPFVDITATGLFLPLTLANFIGTCILFFGVGYYDYFDEQVRLQGLALEAYVWKDVYPSPADLRTLGETP